MSVINQMLKDLDNRQELSTGGHQSTVVVPAQKSRTALVVVTTVVTTLILVALVYLYAENQSLKQLPHQPIDIAKQASISNKTDIEKAPYSVKQEGSEREDVVSIDVPVIQKADNVEPLSKQGAIIADNNSTKDAKSAVEKQLIQVAQQPLTKQVDANKPDVFVTDKSVSNSVKQSAQATEATITPAKVESKPVLSISRKQLSPEELATKKMTLAEQAVRENDIPLAEQYFEEVLLITPTHSTARKQLAALLYGRQSTQAAINVLAQGINLTPDDAELRLMSAKIYAERDLNQQALSVLSALPDNPSVEYQSLLATTAQSIEQFEQAKKSYYLLTQLQSTQGRWYLGLAIAHDSLGEYNAAYRAYTETLNLGGISESAMNFAKQRTLELGEQ